MLVITAEGIAGTSIEETIEAALDLSSRTGCIVRIDINDVTMSILDSIIYGKTRGERVQNYLRQFKERRESVKNPQV